MGYRGKTAAWRIAAAVLAIGTIACISAPRVAAQRLDGGVKAGLSIADLIGDDVDPYEPGTLAAFTGGGFLTLRLTNAFALQPEVSFVRKGAEVSFTDEDGDVTGEIRMDYVEVPVLLRLSTPPRGARSLILAALAGPVVSFNSECEIEASSGDSTVTEPCDRMDTPIRSTEWGVAFGAGLGFPVGPGHIWLDARYVYGLTTIDDSDLEEDVRNRHVAFTAGFSVPLWRGSRTLAARR